MFQRLMFAAVLGTMTLLPAPPAALSADKAPQAAPPAPEMVPYVDLTGRESTHEPGKAKMTVFMDFYCPHCHKFDQTVVPILKKEHGDHLQITYVGYPIVDPQASHIPVLAYYLAEEQGKGEVMKNLLFTAIHDHRLDVTRPEILLAIAQKAGLDLEQFKKGFNENRMMGKLEDGVAEGKAIGVRGTPTVLIDNHIRVNLTTLQTIEEVLAKVLES